jgi:7-cyano-7-deazaguanine synthase
VNVLLLSGGIESTCVAYWKRPQLCVTIDYGQPSAEMEIETASTISKALSLRHRTIIASAGKKFTFSEYKKKSRKNPEFWPYRNQLLATITVINLFGTSAKCLWFGTVKSDNKFLDGSKNFFRKMNSLTSFQEGGMRIEAPAIELSTEKLIDVSKTPRSILGATFSCHRGNTACGDCPGCRKQRDVLYFCF